MLDFLFLGIPAVIVFMLSFLFESKTAYWIVRVGSIWFMLSFSITAFVAYDCEWSNLAFHSCYNIPKEISRNLTIPHFLNMLSYIYLGPLLLIISIIIEFWVRRKKGTLVKADSDKNNKLID